jgi:hypothetical protein
MVEFHVVIPQPSSIDVADHGEVKTKPPLPPPPPPPDTPRYIDDEAP